MKIGSFDISHIRNIPSWPQLKFGSIDMVPLPEDTLVQVADKLAVSKQPEGYGGHNP
jgi:hypothetical protein